MDEFVILAHQLPNDSARANHWDLMLEKDGTLLTWELDSSPLEQANIHAQRLPNHRLDYLEFEGEISGNRGRVQQIARGKFQVIHMRDWDNWTIEFELRSGAKVTMNLQNSNRLTVA